MSFAFRLSFLSNIAIVVASLLISALAAEFTYRYYLASTNHLSVPATGSQYDFYRFDARLGWSNSPGMKGIYRRKEFSYNIEINSHGFRQKEVTLEKPKHLRRIAMLGDSFVWGIGVSDVQRLSELLEKKLSGVEVLNFGVSGYAPIQYLLMLDSVLKFDPDLVVLVICLANDFGDNVLWQRYGYYKPYAHLNRETGLKIRGYPLPNVRKFRFLGTHRAPLGSMLLAELQDRIVWSRMKHKQAGLSDFKDGYLYKLHLNKQQQIATDTAVLLNRLLLKQIKQKLDKVGVRLIITSAPSKNDYKNPKHNASAEELLRASSNSLEIPFIRSVSHLTINDFWHFDGHWNPSGHKKMALLLAKDLDERLDS